MRRKSRTQCSLVICEEPNLRLECYQRDVTEAVTLETSCSRGVAVSKGFLEAVKVAQTLATFSGKSRTQCCLSLVWVSTFATEKIRGQLFIERSLMKLFLVFDQTLRLCSIFRHKIFIDRGTFRQ